MALRSIFRFGRSMPLSLLKGSVAKISIKRLDEENCLRVLGRHIFHGLGVQHLQSDGIKRIDRIIAQQLLNRTQFTRLRQPPDSVVLIPNNNAITI